MSYRARDLPVNECNYSCSFICLVILRLVPSFFFFFNDTATTEIYTLSLHDALPISVSAVGLQHTFRAGLCRRTAGDAVTDRKSTRLNSSHLVISYAVFCLKKKKKNRATHDVLFIRATPALPYEEASNLVRSRVTHSL